jgi:hypothetical protein
MSSRKYIIFCIFSDFLLVGPLKKLKKTLVQISFIKVHRFGFKNMILPPHLSGASRVNPPVCGQDPIVAPRLLLA